MRLFVVVLVVLGLIVISFVFTNPEQPVDVNVWGKTFYGVELNQVALAAFTVGALFVAAIALIEGSVIRWSNRRFRKRVQELETEVGFLREQSRSAASPAPRPGPADPPPVAKVSQTNLEKPVPVLRDPPASAPVYSAEGAADPEDLDS